MTIRQSASPQPTETGRTAALDTATPFEGKPAGFGARLAWSLATAPGISRRWRKTIRKKLANRTPGPFDVVVEGIAFRAYPAENRCDRVLVGRSSLPEPAEHGLLLPFIAAGDVFVDVGANVGTYALWASRHVGAGGTVIAIEPHPRTFAKLCFNRAANGATNVIAVNAGAGETQGSAALWFGGGNVGHASFLPDDQGDAARTIAVPVAPLPDILRAHSVAKVDVLKIDVEGFEDRTLLALFETADTTLWPRTLMIETVLSHRWERDCVAFVRDRGYMDEARTAENIILRHG